MTDSTPATAAVCRQGGLLPPYCGLPRGHEGPHDNQPTTTAATDDMPERTFSGLTYTLTRGGRRATCQGCDAIMPNANESLYEHAARCPSRGWAHGV